MKLLKIIILKQYITVSHIYKILTQTIMIIEDFFDGIDFTSKTPNEVHRDIITKYCDKYWKTFNLDVGELTNMDVSQRKDNFKKLVEFKVKSEIDPSEEYSDLLESIVTKYSALIINFNS